MENSFWSKIKWLFNSFREIKKKAYPLANMGVKLIIISLAGPTLAAVIHFYFPEGYEIPYIKISGDEASIYSMAVGTLAFVVGVFLILYSVKSNERSIAKVLISGLPGTSNDFPNELLFRTEQSSSREAVELSVPEGEGVNFKSQIERYNAELAVDIFRRFILHKDCKKIYIGGLSRVPFLVAYGALLRNISSQIVCFDKLHADGSWKLLNDEDNNVCFLKDKNDTQPNPSGKIGIAISFSNLIQENQLPEDFKGHTLFLKPNLTTERNLIKNQENLNRLSEYLRDIIENYSRSASCKQVHLFLACQSSFALELGRRYQEGTQCNWVIHNFNFNEGKYDWALELSKHGIKQYEPEQDDTL